MEAAKAKNTPGGWTGAQFSLLRIATALASLYWALSHTEFGQPFILSAASIGMALGWFTRLNALIALAFTSPVLGAALPLFIIAPEGPYGSLRDTGIPWWLSESVLWISRLATLALLAYAWPAADYWPLGIFAAMTLITPSWIPARDPATIERLYYDGNCGLCHNFIRFLLSEDPFGTRFRFAPLDSDSFRVNVPESTRANLPDSVVIWTAQGRALTKSEAVLHVLHRLGGYWRILAFVVTPVPGLLRNAVYDFIAGVRYKLFAKPEAVCPLMPKELRHRFEV
jgi:predicted DCC family thiol-disulfide oxidoreductase YuxK